jgi:hypothetical protein
MSIFHGVENLNISEKYKIAIWHKYRDGSSVETVETVEKESRTRLPHAVRYATKESPCCIPAACGIVPSHLILPGLNPDRI